MDRENMHFACEELVRELCRLVDSGCSIDIDRFDDLCDKERFIEHLFLDHGDFVQLPFLDKNSTNCRTENLDYINDAFGRHAGEGDYGLNNNAYLLAINFVVQILLELTEAQKEATSPSESSASDAARCRS